MSAAGSMRGQQNGFTLIEVLAVVLVLAILAGLVTTRFITAHDDDVLQATAYELASRCRMARANAIRYGSPQVVLINLSTRMVVGQREVAPLIIPATVSIRAETISSERRSPSIAGIRFFPTGSSSGGILRLEAGKRAYDIRINWFTGRVLVNRSS